MTTSIYSRRINHSCRHEVGASLTVDRYEMDPHETNDHPMLVAYQRARTAYIDEAERSVSRLLSHHRVVSVNGELDLMHNAVRLGGLTLHYINYGAELTINLEAPYEPYYLVQIPLAGSMRVVRDRTEIDAGAGTAVITAPGHVTSTLQYSADCARLLVKIQPKLVEERQNVVASQEQADGHTWGLPDKLDVDQGAGRTWVDLLRTSISDLDSGAGMLSLPNAVNYFENLLIDGLLLMNGDSPPAIDEAHSHVLHDALQYIDTHITRPLRVKEIAEATHMSVRALQSRFQKELGLSPLVYVRNRRLEAIYDELQAAANTAYVYEVAAKYGVTHLSRFAAAYRERFGESPSETIRAAMQDSHTNLPGTIQTWRPPQDL